MTVNKKRKFILLTVIFLILWKILFTTSWYAVDSPDITSQKVPIVNNHETDLVTNNSNVLQDRLAVEGQTKLLVDTPKSKASIINSNISISSHQGSDLSLKSSALSENKTNVKTKFESKQTIAGKQYVPDKISKDRLIFNGFAQPGQVDSRYGDYTNQNGTLIIERTISSITRNISIMIDPSLKNHFPTLEKCAIECRFEFTDDLSYIARHGDSFISPESDSADPMNNTALHFTKVHYPIKGKDVNTLKWRGTDIYTSLQTIDPKYERSNQIFIPPLRIGVNRMSETQESLMQPVDFSKKKDLVTIIVADCTPSITRDLASNTIRHLKNHNYSFNIFPLNCYPENKNQICADVDCSIKISTAVFLFDDSYEMVFTQSYFWKSIRYGTYVFYHWPISIDKLAPGMCSKLDNTNYIERLGATNIESLKIIFLWKEEMKFPEILKSVVESNEHTFPCQICEHVRIRKLSTTAMLTEVQKLKVANTPQSLGILTGLTDGVFVAHYSKATARATHMTNMMNDWNIEPKFITAFDKQDLNDKVFRDVYAPKNNPYLYPHIAVDDLKWGELSLSVKMFWAYYWLLVNDFQSIIIFEDDVELQKTAEFTMVKDLLETLPKNYATAHFGSCLFSKDLGVSIYNIPVIENERQVVQSVGEKSHCTSAYSISKQGAILNFKSLPLTKPIDWQMLGGSGINHPDWNVYGIWPPLFVPSDDVNQHSPTDIRSR